MPTMTRTRKSVKTKPFTCSIITLTIEISDTRYAVDQIPAGEFGTRAFRLCKASGDHEVYDVIRTHAGIVSCSCPDYIARHEGHGYGMCKHGRALVELGLLAAPIAPEFAPIVPPAVEMIAEPCCGKGEPIPCQACVEAPAAPAPATADVFPADQVDPGDVEGDPELWPEGWDDHVWNLGPAPAAEPTADDLAELADASRETAARELLDGSERLTLAELVDRQVSFYESWGNAAGSMLATAMAELALKVRMTEATTPAEYDARIAVLDEGIRSDWESRGYEAACDQLAPA